MKIETQHLLIKELTFISLFCLISSLIIVLISPNPDMVIITSLINVANVSVAGFIGFLKGESSNDSNTDELNIQQENNKEEEI